MAYQCPGCGERVILGQAERKVATFRAHRRCPVDCGICGKTIEDPPLGQRHTVVAWCGQPAHAACRDTEREAMRVTETREPDARGWADQPEQMRPSRTKARRQHGREEDWRPIDLGRIQERKD